MRGGNMKWSIIILSISLILCLAPMPYGYFILVRYAATILFFVMAYKYHWEKNNAATCFWTVLAILFQPIFKIALGRVLWNIIDVVVAIILSYVLWKGKKENLN